MSEAELDLLDDYVFEPSAWDLAFTIGIGVDPETDRDALDELADAMLMWAPEPILERLTTPALEALWDDEIEQWTRDGLARLAAKEGWEEAAEVNRQMLELFPNDVDTFNRLGKSLLELGRYQDSLEAYTQANRLDPTSIAAGFDLFEAQKAKNLNDDALATLERISRLPDTPARVLYEQAAILHRKADYAKAWEKMNAYIARRPATVPDKAPGASPEREANERKRALSEIIRSMNSQ